MVGEAFLFFFHYNSYFRWKQEMIWIPYHIPKLINMKYVNFF